jgi:DNA polymerase-3 subunit chi
VLTDATEGLPHHDVLLNLADAWPPFFATFDRVLEIVSSDEQDKLLARGRYTFYKDAGYDIKVNAIGEA